MGCGFGLSPLARVEGVNVSDDLGHGFTIEDLKAFLDEDRGTGDWTTEWTVPREARARARIFAKAPLTVSGVHLAEAVFRLLDPEIRLTPHAVEGSTLLPGALLLEAEGRTRTILLAERTALNLLGRLSGIATLTRTFVEAARATGGGARILDTRKTTPGWRVAEKTAVRHGGGWNHRFGLHDMVLLKENHIEAAGGILAAVARVRDANHAGLPVEVEVRSLDELDLLEGVPGVNRVLLDNFSLEDTRAAVSRVRGWAARHVELEASGNMSIDRVAEVSATGVDWISVGALTHSAPVADFSLLLESLLPQTVAGSPWGTQSTEAWAGTVRVPQFELADAVTSTNDRLRIRAEAGALPFTTCVALTQTQGRGRDGRGWDSPVSGGLWMSVLLPFPNGGAPGVAPLAVGVACARALEACGVKGVSLKWPNDLVHKGGKLGGILCEVVSGGIVAGIGINLTPPYDEAGSDAVVGAHEADSVAPLPRRWANQIAAVPIEAPDLTRVILGELRQWANPPADTLEGVLRVEWDARDALRGHEVTVRSGQWSEPRIREGRADGVTPRGALRLMRDDGTLDEVVSGSVRWTHSEVDT